MKFRYSIEKVSKNGTKDLLNRDFDQSELVLGRGSACDIILESSFISLTHAKISFPSGKLFIEDLGSLSGTRVNDGIVKQKELRDGDEIKLGDVVLKVFFTGGIWGILEHREEKEKINTEELVARDLNRSDIFQSWPRIRFLSLIFFIGVVGYFFIVPLMSSHQDVWSSGPISNNHRMIASDCLACHGATFERVPDDKCLTCHNMTDHTTLLKEHGGRETRCATCHMEHNGDKGLIQRDSRMCVNCHGNIKAVTPESQAPDVVSFSAHPEFSVSIQPPLPGGEFTRVRLDDESNLRDNSNVKLNHEVHLRSIRGKNGMVKLDCRDCHNASPDLKTIEKISFENHCESCHGLEFDDRLPGRQVPHGDPNVVFKFLYAEYAKLLLSSHESPKAQQNFARFKPGGSLPSVTAESSQDDFKKAFVERESRNAERLLFTKTACYLCHRVAEKTISPSDAESQAVSRYEVLTPQIPTRWMPQSIFDHGAHEAVRCDDCHKGVQQSTKRNQVLLPRKEKCTECHNDHGGNGLVKSDCVMCHSYHDQKLIPSAAKRLAEEILKTK